MFNHENMTHYHFYFFVVFYRNRTKLSQKIENSLDLIRYIETF